MAKLQKLQELTKTKDLEQKLKTMFQAMQRMEKLLKRTEAKASRAMDQSRKTTFEVMELKSALRSILKRV